jgi:ATP-dependent Clp protease protease subunit
MRVMTNDHDNGLARINVVNFDEATVDEMRRSVNHCLEHEQPAMMIDICTEGGYVYELLAMIDLVEAAKAKGVTIVTYASGKALSSGAVLLASGTPGHRYAGHHATVMVHEVHGGASGEPTRATGGVRELTRLNKRLIGLLGEYSGKGYQHFVELIQSKDGPDVYLDAPKAKRNGLVDHIGTPFHLARTDISHVVV